MYRTSGSSILHYMDIQSYRMLAVVTLVIVVQDGHTALMIASYEGHVKVINLLLAANADVNAVNIVSIDCVHQ